MEKKPDKDESPKKKAPKSLFKEGKFKIPDSFFNQLTEFSNGGWVVAIVNGQGQPEIYTKFDSFITAVGMQRFLLDYFEAINMANTNSIQTDITEKENEENEEYKDSCADDDDDD